MDYEKFFFDLKEFIFDLVDSVKVAQEFMKSLKDKNSPVSELPNYIKDVSRLDGFMTVLVRLTEFISIYEKGVNDES